jgi:tetratricopeptide (TPR) repeat protein
MLTSMQIKVLGRFAVEVAGRPDDPFHRVPDNGVSVQLLAALALAGRAGLTLPDVARCIFGGELDPVVRARINTALYDLRRRLPTDPVDRRTTVLRLLPDVVTVDCDEFEARVAAGAKAWARRRFSDALVHYRTAWRLWTARDVLDGFPRRDAVEDLLEAGSRMRELEELRERALLGLAECLVETGEAVEAVSLLRAGSLRAVRSRDRRDDVLARAEYLVGNRTVALGLAADAGLKDRIRRDSPLLQPCEPKDAWRRDFPQLSQPLLVHQRAVAGEVGTLLGRAATEEHSLVVVVTGEAGVGKSWVIRSVAEQVAPLFPGGVHYLDVRKLDHENPADSARRQLLAPLGFGDQDLPSDPGRLAANYKDVLERSASARLLILDNAVDPGLISALRVGPAMSVLASTRRLAFVGDRTFSLEADSGDGLELLAALAPNAGLRPDDAQRLVEACYGLPLLIAAVGHQIAAGRGGGEVLEALRRPGGATDQNVVDPQAWTPGRRGDPAPGATVGRVLLLGLEGQPERAVTTYRTIGGLDLRDVSVTTAAVLSGLPPQSAAEDLDLLRDARLLEYAADPERSNQNRFLLHALYADALGGRSASRLPAFDGSPGFSRLIATGAGLAEHIEPGRLEGILAASVGPGSADLLIEQTPGWAWIDDDHAMVRSAAQRLAQQHRAEESFRLALVFRPVLELRGLFDLARRLHEIAYAVQARDDESSLGWLEIGLGRLERYRGNYDKGLWQCRRALVRFRETGDLLGQAEALRWQADLRVGLAEDGDLGESRSDLAAARELYARIPHPRGLAAIAAAEGELRGLQGRTEESLALLEEARDRLESLDDRFAVARLLRDLGVIMRRLGRTRDSSAYLRDCRNRAQDLGDRFLEGQALCSLGVARAEAGDVDEALTLLASSVRIMDAVRDRRWQVQARRWFVRFLLDTGDPVGARVHAEWTRAVARELGSAELEATMAQLVDEAGGSQHLRLDADTRPPQVEEPVRR